jgi:hypothetical protein
MEKIISKSDLEYLATKVASNFINDKIPLNESIKKMANEEYLTSEHLKRLVEMSNSKVYQHKYNTEEGKNIEFDVANPNEIIKEVQEEPVKAAFDLTPYQVSPKYKQAKINKIASTLNQDLEAAPTFTIDNIKTARIYLEKAKDELEDRKLSHTMKVADNYKQLLRETKDLLNQTDFNKIANAVYLAAPEILENLTIDLLDQKLITDKDLEIYKVANLINEDNKYIKLAKQIKTDLDHCLIYDFAIKEAETNLELLKETN